MGSLGKLATGMTLWSMALVTLARGDEPRPAGAPSVAVKSWNAQAAAGYLDARARAWLAWPKAQQADGTACVSCHTAFPYLAVRAPLARKLGDRAVAPLDEYLAHVTKRVASWQDGKPWYGFSEEKSAESRATESVLNALVLAIRDAESLQPKLREDTAKALAAMWAAQQQTGPAAGSWPWLEFKLDPWESPGAEYWGATLAALAVAFAPENYAARTEIAPQRALLQKYLLEHLQADKPSLHHRTMLLLASRRGAGLCDAAGQAAIVQELLAAQKDDGSWSMEALGDWKLKDASGDAYATGLVAFVLWHVDDPSCRAAAKKGCQWLADHQDQATGGWPSKSVNKSRDPASFVGQFMQDAATAFATLALLVNE